MLPHARDAQVQTTELLAATTQRLMADPTTRPETLTYANKGFGLDRLAYRGEAGAYAAQTGEIITRWDSQWARPEIWLFDLHHHLFAGEQGMAVAGFAGVAGIVFVVSGLVLWWRNRRMFEPRLLPRKFARPQILRHHRDLGVMAAPFLLVSLITGSSLVFRPLTALYLGPDAPAVVTKVLAAPPSEKTKLGDHIDWAGIIRTARERFPEAEVRSLALPRGESGLITLRMRRPEEWLPNGRTTLWFAADTGALVAARDSEVLPRAVRAYNALYPLHAAKVGGLAYKLAMSFSGLSLTLLGSLAVWSFWFGKPRAASRKRCKPATAPA
jgi:uncharacterized iron-regulated membrane protein